jgi:hypothetical protein
MPRAEGTNAPATQGHDRSDELHTREINPVSGGIGNPPCCLRRLDTPCGCRSVCCAEIRRKFLAEITIELTRSAWVSIGGNAETLEAVSFTGEGELSLAYAVTDFVGAADCRAAHFPKRL